MVCVHTGETEAMCVQPGDICVEQRRMGWCENVPCCLLPAKGDTFIREKESRGWRNCVVSPRNGYNVRAVSQSPSDHITPISSPWCGRPPGQRRLIERASPASHRLMLRREQTPSPETRFLTSRLLSSREARRHEHLPYDCRRKWSNIYPAC